LTRIVTKSAYGDVKKIFIDDFSFPIYEVSNFIPYRDYTPSSQQHEIDKTVSIKEKVFIIDILGYSHFHFIYDKIAQYEFIKKYIPDLSLYVISNDYHIEKDNGALQELTKFYSIPKHKILNINSQEAFTFTNVYFVWSTHNRQYSDCFQKEYFDPWQHRDDFSFYIKTIYALLQEKFKDYIAPKINKDQKIFISRFKQHEVAGRKSNEARYISKDDEIALEKFFESKGYKIYSAEELTLSEQIELYSGSSHVAALKSSALVNTIFCKPETAIIGINLDDEYQVWYDYICIDAGLNYLELPQIMRNGVPTLSYSLWAPQHTRTVFSLNQILLELEKVI
jgi:hypothetical protein